MGLSLRNLGKKVWDQINVLDDGRTWSNPNPQAVQQKQAQDRAAQARAYQAGIRAPSYGTGINRYVNAARDVFDANTAQDKFKRDLGAFRTQSPMAPSPIGETYLEQQKRLGNKFAGDNVGENLFQGLIGRTAAIAKTGIDAERANLDLQRAAGAKEREGTLGWRDRVGLLTSDLLGQVTNPLHGPMSAYQKLQGYLDQSPSADIVQQANQNLDARLNARGPLGVQSMVNAEQSQNLSPSDIAKTSASYGIGSATEVIPLTKGYGLATTPVKGMVAKNFAKNLAGDFALGTTGSAVDQYIQTGKIDPMQAAKGGVISAGAGSLGYGLGTLKKSGLPSVTPKTAVPDPTDLKIQKRLNERPSNLRKIEQTTTNMSDEARLKLAKGDKGQAGLMTAKPGTRRFNPATGKIETITPEAKPKVQPKQAPELPTVRAKEPVEIDVRNGLGTQVKTAIVEKDTPVIKTLKEVEKKTGKKGIVDQFMYDSGLVNRSDSIANTKLANNENIRNAFKGMTKKDLKQFNDYAAARAELTNAARDMKTSKSVASLESTVNKYGQRFSSRYDSLNKFYKDYAKDLKDAGIIDEETFKKFTASGDYTRIQRDMSDVVGFKGSGGRGYSLKTTLTSKKRVGSKRDVLPADRTAFDYAQKAQGEIQRNKAASNLIDAFEGTDLIRKIEKGERTSNKNTIGRFKNGVQEQFEVSPEIKQVVDNISPYQLNALQKIVALPKRVFQAGTTGLSAPFTIANYVKDQIGSGINSKSIVDTHNPVNIVRGLKEAVQEFGGMKNSDAWERFAAHAGDTTQFDLLRGAKSANQLSRELRTGGRGKAINMVLSPIKTLEDFVSITEKATRFQNFKGMEDAIFKKTGNRTQALQEATLAAWQNSVDFNRYGEWGKTLNLLIPYFNSGIQGSRQLVRSFQNRPLATTAKTMGLIGLPLVQLTAWNMADKDRKDVYDNISDFEKENNFILIPPGELKQNTDGTYNVFKVPMPPGYSNLMGPARRAMESFANKSPQDWAGIAQDIMGSVAGPINTNSPKQAAAGLIPQMAKPFVQQVANKDFFTDKPIVPDYVNEATDAAGNPVKESDKAYDYTSGSARFIGNITKQSPIRVEKFFKDSFGRVGQYGTNALDNALARMGVIKPDQIGGISVKDDLTRRFTKAQGDYNYMKSAGGKYFDAVKQATASLNSNEKAAYGTLHPSKTNFLGEEIFDENKRIAKYARAGIYLQYPKVFAADKALNDSMAKQGNPSNPLYELKPEQLTRVLLKATLPPGAKDPELSKLYEQEWYQDYNVKRSKYYEGVKAKLAADGKSMPKSDNPYPEADANLQKAMDAYNSLPKGTGARSNWIKSNGPTFELMKQNWAAVDAWENKERQELGLSPIEAEDGYSGGYAKGGGGGGSYDPTANPEKFKLSRNAGGQVSLKTAVSVKAPKGGGGKSSAKKGGKPKVTLKKSQV